MARLDTDEGARRVGEFAIGTNEMIQRAVGDTLFDEKIGGTCHLALGRSFPHARRREPVGDPLGPGLRPARRRAHRRRRRATAERRKAAGLMDPFDDLYARVIVEHALAVRSGQTVLIEAGEAAEPLARAVHRRVLEAGGPSGACS